DPPGYCRSAFQDPPKYRETGRILASHRPSSLKLEGSWPADRAGGAIPGPGGVPRRYGHGVRTAFRNVRVFDGTSEALTPPTTVTVDGRFVASVGEPPPPDADQFD